MVYRSNYKRPQFPPKVVFDSPNYRLHASHVASHVGWPSWTLLTVRPAQQDAVLLRRRTTAALINLQKAGQMQNFFHAPPPPPFTTVYHYTP